MKAQFSANEFSRLFDMTAQALVSVDEVIAQYEARLEGSAPQTPPWWKRILGDGPDFSPYRMTLQINLAALRDRREAIEGLMSMLDFATSHSAEVVTLSQGEMDLLRMYGHAA